MRELIEKKAKTGKIFGFLVLALIVAWMCVLVFVMPNVAFETSYAIIMSLMVAIIVCGVVYLVSYKPAITSVKWLAKKGMENIAEDVSLEKPTLPESEIYCGRKALCSKKPCLIIPYQEIAWVHLFEQRAYGFTVKKSVVIYTKDGKKFVLKYNDNELKWLLANYIVPNSPNLIMGFGAAQKKRFKELYPNASKFSFKK